MCNTNLGTFITPAPNHIAMMKLCLVLVMLALACSGSVAQTSLRVINASPLAPSFDWFINGSSSPLASGVAYKQISPYRALPSSLWTSFIQAFQSGVPTSDTLYLATTQFLGDFRYTLASVGVAPNVLPLLFIDPVLEQHVPLLFRTMGAAH